MRMGGRDAQISPAKFEKPPIMIMFSKQSLSKLEVLYSIYLQRQHSIFQTSNL